MREHVKHQWNYSMNMTKENSEEAQASMLRLATFKAQWQKNAKNFEPYYRDLLNQLEIKQMESVLRIGEGEVDENIFIVSINIYLILLEYWASKLFDMQQK